MSPTGPRVATRDVRLPDAMKLPDARKKPHRLRLEAAQTTAEYALVVLGAAALATLLIAWATRTDAVGRLFDAVLERVLSGGTP